MFIRRLYYRKISGDMLVSYMMSGCFIPATYDRDFKIEQSLIPYTERRDEVGLFEWTQPDPDIERAFAESYGVSVDMSVEPPQLVFDYTLPELPPLPSSDADELMNILRGVIE